MNSSKKFKVTAALASLCACGMSTQAMGADDNPLALEEVVVTATKRGEASLQEIPMSISVCRET